MEMSISVSMLQTATAGCDPTEARLRTVSGVQSKAEFLALRSTSVSTFFWVLVPVWNSMPCPPEMVSRVSSWNDKSEAVTAGSVTPSLDWSSASGWIEAEMRTWSLGVSPFW